MGIRQALQKWGTADAAPRSCPGCLPKAQLRALVRQHGTPLLVIDCAQVRANYQSLRAALPGVSVHYAVKALPLAEVLSTLHDEGSHFDVASTGELELLRKQGVRPERVIHTHPVKTAQEIDDAVASGCTTFVFDNADEVRKFTPHRERVKLMLRVGFRNADATVDLSKKFGAAPDEALSLLKLAHELGLKVIGLTFHVGSQCATSRAHVRAIEVCNELRASAERARLPPLHVLDIGGGFPAPYQSGTLDIEAFCAPIREALAELPAHVQVISEPGRYLVASAGHSASSVIGRARRDGAPWYYLDDGVYGLFGAQVFDGISYPLTVLTANLGPSKISHLAGPTCDSGDMVSDGISLPPLEIGDVVIAHLMGAYTSVTANDFNSVRRAKVLSLNGPTMESGVIYVGAPVA